MSGFNIVPIIPTSFTVGSASKFSLAEHPIGTLSPKATGKLQILYSVYCGASIVLFTGRIWTINHSERLFNNNQCWKVFWKNTVSEGLCERLQRDSNPWLLAWQASVLTYWTTEPYKCHYNAIDLRVVWHCVQRVYKPRPHSLNDGVPLLHPTIYHN